MKTATASWPTNETDPQRIAILEAADRLLSGTPQRSTGNLSIVQLAVEANVKYWLVAQKHPDLRDHFQQLVLHRPPNRSRVPRQPRTLHPVATRPPRTQEALHGS